MRAIFIIASIATLIAAACSLSENCETATATLGTSISTMCKEGIYTTTPFCSVCAANGFFSIDDLCNCRPLTLDADFCAYDDSPTGISRVRDALDYARTSCQGGANLPYDFDGGSDAWTSSSSSSSSSGGGSGGMTGNGSSGGATGGGGATTTTTNTDTATATASTGP